MQKVLRAISILMGYMFQAAAKKCSRVAYWCGVCIDMRVVSLRCIVSVVSVCFVVVIEAVG